jgi:predicted Zn-dependent protease
VPTAPSGEKEPLAKAFFSLPLLAVLVLGFLFWYTSINIDRDLKTIVSRPQPASELYTTDQIFADVAALPPSQLQAEGKRKEAAEAATTMVTEHPYDVPSLMAAGNVLCQNPDKSVAAEGFRLLRRSLYLAPQSRWVRINLARQLNAAKRYEEAESQYVILFEVATGAWLQPHYELAQLYMDEKQFDKAAEQLHYALQIDTKRGMSYRQIAVATAASASADQQDSDSFDEFKKGVVFEQNVERGPLQRCPGEVEALVVLNDKDPAKALAKVQDQIKASPDDGDLQIEAVQLMLACNKLDDAKTALDNLEKNDKDDPDVYLTRAQLLLMQNNETGAKAAFNQAIKLLREGS